MNNEIEQALPIHAERNYGIDFLRIVSCIMVIILHLMKYGGLQNEIAPLTANYEVLWFLVIAADCAVNCFGMISGYVSYGKKFKYTNIIYLYLNVVVYSLLFQIPAYIIQKDNFTFFSVLQIIFPALNHTYWYYSSYFIAFFFMPLLNHGMMKLNKKQSNVLIFALIFFSIVSTISYPDLLGINGGYSPLWLIVLFLIGCYIKKYQDDIRKRPWHLFVLYIFCVSLTWFIKLICEFTVFHKMNYLPDLSMLIAYCSPTILFSAIALVIMFSKMQIKKKFYQVIEFFAPLTFSVYIIHEHPTIRSYIISGSMLFVAQKPLYFQILILFGFAFGLWAVCSFLDYIRYRLFQFLKIKKRLKMLESHFHSDGVKKEE